MGGMLMRLGAELGTGMFGTCAGWVFFYTLRSAQAEGRTSGCMFSKCKSKVVVL